MIAGILIIGFCLLALFNDKVRVCMQKFLDSSLGVIFKKKGK